MRDRHKAKLDQVTLTLRAYQAPSGPDPRCYLMVIAGQRSTLFHLPLRGEVVVGRGKEVDLPLEDPAASRRHARLVCDHGSIAVEDLGSHNGTRVNGERLRAPRPLSPGDVISICAVTLVFHRDARWTARRRIADGAALQSRLEEEVERALRYQCPLSLLALSLGEHRLDRSGLEEGLSAELRVMDHLAQVEGQLVLLLPELQPEEADALAGRLLAGFARDAPEARAGRASCPADGADADTLIAAALLAARAARPGQVAGVDAAQATVRLGQRDIIVADPVMVRLYELLGRLAQGDLPVLLYGETGTGKEIAAEAIHHHSPRRDEPFVALNCAALPETLLEGELFGYEKGAFSGAAAARPGLLERAHGGTLFLDELGEMSPAAQAKLLRALEIKRVTRLGDVRERPVDLRIVAATNRDLEDEVNAGRFRQDLLFRLNAAVVTLPPLRDRPRELPLLARLFLRDARARLGRPELEIAPQAMRRLLTHSWPGNLRELRNVMEYVAAVTAEPVAEIWHLPERMGRSVETPAQEGAAPPGAPSQGTAPGVGGDAGPAARPRHRPLAEEVRELERSRIAEALATAGGVKTVAAELISMPLRTFADKCKLYGLPGRGPAPGK